MTGTGTGTASASTDGNVSRWVGPSANLVQPQLFPQLLVGLSLDFQQTGHRQYAKNI